MVVQQPEKRGVPVWVHALCWGLIMVIDVGLFAFVVLMLAFSCDSGWTGCAELAESTIVVFFIFAILVATAPLIAAFFNLGSSPTARSMRVAMLVAILISPVLVFAISVIYYVIGYNVVQ